jgi:hypothetical protein
MTEAMNDNSFYDADDLLELFRSINEGAERTEHFDHEDRIIGTHVRYKSGLEIFHPYIPLQIYRGGKFVDASPRPTRNEFLMGCGTTPMGSRFKSRYNTEH